MTRPADRNLRTTSGSGCSLQPGEAGFDWPDCARPGRPGRGRGVRLAFALLWGLLGVAVFSPLLAGDRPIVIHASFPGVLERHLDHLARAYPYDVRHGLPGVVHNVGATLQAMARLVDPARRRRSTPATSRPVEFALRRLTGSGAAARVPAPGSRGVSSCSRRPDHALPGALRFQRMGCAVHGWLSVPDPHRRESGRGCSERASPEMSADRVPGRKPLCDNRTRGLGLEPPRVAVSG